MKRLIMAENEITDKMYKDLAKLKIEKQHKEDLLTDEELEKLKVVYKNFENIIEQIMDKLYSLEKEADSNKELLTKVIYLEGYSSDLLNHMSNIRMFIDDLRREDCDFEYFAALFDPIIISKKNESFKEYYLDEYLDDYENSIKTIDEYNKEKNRLNEGE